MRNIIIALDSDYEDHKNDDFEMRFRFQEVEGPEIVITSINRVDDSHHLYAITKDEYLFLRDLFDKYFNVEDVKNND